MLIIDPLDGLLNERDIYPFGLHLLNEGNIGRHDTKFFDEADF